MRQKLRCFLFVILSVFIGGCATVYKGDDFTTPKDEILPPGEEYTAEHDKCLNVVYYVPADTVEWSNWHYRLSGITLQIQKFFGENLKRHQVNRNFGLVVNENPEYVKIHYIKSSRKCNELSNSDIVAMKNEVLDYFNQNPGERLSDNFLVFMPHYAKSFMQYLLSDDGVGMVFCGCDDERFDMKFFNSPRGRALYLSSMGEILYNLARSFCLPTENHGRSDTYLHLMGSEIYKPFAQAYRWEHNYTSYSGSYSGSFVAGTPDKIRLSASSANILGTHPLFQNDDVGSLSVEILKTEIASFEGEYVGVDYGLDSLFVTCHFRADRPIKGMVMTLDPWRSRDLEVSPQVDMPEWDRDPFNDTGFDSYAIWRSVYDMEEDPETGGYIARFRVSMGELRFKRIVLASSSTPNNNEIRFRFIGEEGEMAPQYPDVKGGDYIVERTLDAEGKEIAGLQYGFRYVYSVKGTETGSNLTLAHDIRQRYGSRRPLD